MQTNTTGHLNLIGLLCPLLLPLPKSRSPLRFQRELRSPSPILWFSLFKTGSLLFTRIVFQRYGPAHRMENGAGWKSNISTTPRQFSSDFGIDVGFWNDEIQMLRRETLANVLLEGND
ncbi:hypothetical protein AVEN_243384-1 [Araneus ventricosus]|uniref:Uncharacterized protein n=1 Tax=Araneus ventricosus TaxID=182803 RepID=A0A4Y2VSJ8_ARAVE|nr:hypothetical protein AVEN_243384-1 [Araneus ventricosus]